MVASLLVLCIGIAQPDPNDAEDLAETDSIDLTTASSDGPRGFNLAMYAVLAAIGIIIAAQVARRINAALSVARHYEQLRDAAYDGRDIPDDVRSRLDKKWLHVAAAWAAVCAREGRSGVGLVENDRVCVRDGAYSSQYIAYCITTYTYTYTIHILYIYMR